jgi:citrate/tricarballylate utilization protein
VARQLQNLQRLSLLVKAFRASLFPPLTRRLEFGKADIHYMANLCHNCACVFGMPVSTRRRMNLPSHVPKAMATVRGQTYADYAWPPVMGSFTSAMV